MSLVVREGPAKFNDKMEEIKKKDKVLGRCPSCRKPVTEENKGFWFSCLDTELDTWCWDCSTEKEIDRLCEGD